ncbi:tetratricopeptide repeat protein [Actinomyces sp.]|uniref:tetratricopeptide repeat protein n=1 Tax=Actinomyces sp. TaxID=29317 RepID=UPI0026DBBD7F|nr:tetratricopeptide repeat protein [Actinomyces sp.]MDO4899427.1 tetratricopeptide repeat protein [Actinomyces sp.]
MGMPDPLHAVGVDEAWSDLRHHLEWTADRGTVVFIAVQSRDQLEDMRARARMWSVRAHIPWNEAPKGDGVSEWLSRRLPAPGVLWIDAWDGNQRSGALHRLNELRVRLAQRGAGCVIIGGPTQLLVDAVREAVDLWSVRSLVLTIGSQGADRSAFAQAPPLDAETPVPAGDGYRAAWRITLPPDLRSDEAAAVLREVERARRLLATDPVAARRALESSTYGHSQLGRVLFALVRAEIAGMLGDGAGVEVVLSRCIKDAPELPDVLSAQVIDTAWRIAIDFGALESAALAADYQLQRARDQVAMTGTSAARRDLSVALKNVGRVAEVRGDLGTADDAYAESLAFRRELVGELGTPKTWRDLSAVLDNLGRVALVRGDLGAAAEAYRESLVIRRELVGELGSPEARRDLSVALDNVGRVARARGDLGAAAEAYRESLAIRRELADALGTPQARRDLSVALDNVGSVASVRGDWDAADAAYRESLAIRRELADAQGTPQAYQDLAYSLDLVAQAAQARGDSETADALTREHEQITRLIE